MDEPTVGIDPQSRNHILETVKRLSSEGMTVIYTSHYMEEVEYLCSRVAIVDHGQLIALGTKQELYGRLSGGASVKMTVEGLDQSQVGEVAELPGVGKVVLDEGQLTVFAQDVRQVLGDAVTKVLALGAQVQSVDVLEPNLETVFLQLTGRNLRD